MAVAQAPPLERRQPTRGDIDVRQAPLVPLAMAATAGIVLDRYAQLPMALSLAAAVASLLAWLVHRSSSRRLALLYLWLAAAGLGGAYHHLYRYDVAEHDISHAAGAEPVPCRLRGRVESSPQVQASDATELRTLPARSTTRFVLGVRLRQDLARHAWLPARGLVQVHVVGQRTDFTVGDEVEVLGRLVLPEGPANPGELDYAGLLRDQGITAVLTVLDGDQVDVLERSWPRSLFGWLAMVRAWGQQVLAEALPPGQQPLAEALLLGEETSMTRDDWDAYQRTGVIHVLAISGQHLMVLSWFLWCLARLAYVRRRWAATGVALALLAYALLAGARPPVMRAAWMVLAWCIGILLRRPIQVANLYALAWLGVAIFNPTDIFNTGCQLSFLAVAVLLWGTGRWLNTEPDPLQRVIDESRPWVVRWLVRWLRGLGWAYVVNAVVWLAVTPLVAARYHLVAPVALLLGPPVALFASFGLLAGFLLLLLAPWSGPFAWPFAVATRLSLAGGDLLVRGAAGLPGAYFYVPALPEWWLWIFYPALLLALAVPPERRWPWLLAGGAGWLALGVALLLWPHRPGEFRCTFLAVGHGGCTVVETPAGEVLLYDAGAIAGPDVTRRHIAPYLWERRIRRLDEVILSHADLDHFNGVIELAERFPIRRVTSTPSFARRESPAVARTLEALERAAIPFRTVHTPARWEVEGISLDVLHPPAEGPEGNENARSLVLLLRYRGLHILLTGDLEGPGLSRVLAAPAPRIDVLQAPHHGSERSDPGRLAAWARPRVVVSCQARPRAVQQTARPYEDHGALFLATWPHGAVTIRQTEETAWIETYRSGLRRLLP